MSDQSNNPYAPPLASTEPSTDVAIERDEPDELQDILKRILYGFTYGTVFLTGIAYWISAYLLIRVSFRQDEFAPHHKRLFTNALVLCLILFLPIAGLTMFFISTFVFMQVAI